jgi:hypothetical protein
VQHNEKADRIKREEREKIDSMNWMSIKTTETTSFLSKLTTGSLLEATKYQTIG